MMDKPGKPLKKILFIVSPVSRPSWVKRYVPHIIESLNSAGIDVEKALTRGPGDPGRLAGEGAGQYDAVLVAGGDGSINEAMNALAGSKTPVGIIPFGTVNVFAREMAIPLNPLKAAKAFETGQVRSFDMGRFGQRRFLLMASYGFDVHVLERNPAFLKRILGRYSYLLTSLLILPFFRGRPIKLYVDDHEKPREAFFAVFSNSKRYAGEHTIAPDADMNDGLLDLTLVTAPGRLGVLKTMTAFFFGRLSKKPWTETMKAQKVRVENRGKERFQMDGDTFSPEGDEITVERSAICVVVPVKDGPRQIRSSDG